MSSLDIAPGRKYNCQFFLSSEASNSPDYELNTKKCTNLMPDLLKTAQWRSIVQSLPGLPLPLSPRQVSRDSVRLPRLDKAFGNLSECREGCIPGGRPWRLVPYPVSAEDLSRITAKQRDFVCCYCMSFFSIYFIIILSDCLKVCLSDTRL